VFGGHFISPSPKVRQISRTEHQFIAAEETCRFSKEQDYVTNDLLLTYNSLGLVRPTAANFNM
jgi:hypothetical protein